MEYDSAKWRHPSLERVGTRVVCVRSTSTSASFEFECPFATPIRTHPNVPPSSDVICSLCLSTWFRAIRRCIGCKLKRAPKPWEEKAVVPRLARCESAGRTARAHTHGLAVVPATLPMPLWGAAQALAFGIRLSWPSLFLFLLRAAARSRAGQVEKVWVVHEQHRFCFHFVSHQLLI